jgi:hypothetical protein
MPIPAYRAKQSTNTTGTGTIVLNAADTNARNFSAAYGASSRRILYMIAWQTGYEFGLGDFDGGTPGNLTRATVLASSNAGALVTLPAGTKDVFAVFDPSAREVVSISGTATLALADLGNAVVFTGSSAATLNLPAVATAPTGSGWMVRNAGTAALTIDPSGAETINSVSTLVLQAGQAAFIFDGGAAWECIIAGGTTIGAALLAVLSSAAVADLASGAPVDIASAATTDIGAATSPNVRVTGTTPITSLGTAPAGTRRFLTFAAVLTITYNATSLQTPGLASITTAAGDNAVARSLGSGNWVIERYTRAAGLPVAQMATARVLGRFSAGSGPIEEIPLANPAAALSLGINRGTEQATTSGTAIDFTSIPAGVRRVTLLLRGVSLSGTERFLIQIGAGSFVTSGYSSSSSGSDNSGFWINSNSTAGFILGTTFDAANAHSGRLTLHNISGDIWVADGLVTNNVTGGGGRGAIASGQLTLSGTLDRLRLTNTGSNTFDLGAVNIMWEF